MNITTVTVGWQETVSLPEYNNVRPSVSLTATVEEHENPAEVLDSLLDSAKRIVRQEVDHALEMHGQSPKYYEGTRYQAVKSWGQRRVLIIPNSIEIKPSHGDWGHVFGIARSMSLEGITRLLSANRDVENLDGYRLETYTTLLDAEQALVVVRVPELPFD